MQRSFPLLSSKSITDETKTAVWQSSLYWVSINPRQFLFVPLCAIIELQPIRVTAKTNDAIQLNLNHIKFDIFNIDEHFL